MPSYLLHLDVADDVTAPRLEELVRDWVARANDGRHRGFGWREPIKSWRLRAVAEPLSSVERPAPTEAEIVAACNALARDFYAAQGYQVSDDYKFYEATHPQERGCWNLAVLAYDHIQGTDVEDALASLEN